MKVLIIYNKIWSYRVKIFELINEKVELTVAFSDENFTNKKYSFNTLFLPVKKVGPFEIHQDDLFEISSRYDVVIGIFNIRWLSLMKLSLLKNRKFALIYWGIGVTASYENRFDSKGIWSWVRYYIAKRAESLIFYSSYPVEKYRLAGISEKKMFVANNTTEVDVRSEDIYTNKYNFVFIGTLYKQKGIDQLLEAFHRLCLENPHCPCLDIIGEGPEREKIEDFVKENKLEDKIKMHGSIYDAQVLSTHYNKAIACISPNQAGLSVLNSMGNGTMYVTSKNAITGGEIFNIIDRENGLLYNEEKHDLKDVLKWIVDNRELAIQFCMNAREHYLKNRTPLMMAEDILRAVDYSYKLKQR